MANVDETETIDTEKLEVELLQIFYTNLLKLEKYMEILTEENISNAN